MFYPHFWLKNKTKQNKNREDISDLSSNSCRSKSKELKNLIAAGGHGGRIKNNFDDERDEISEKNTTFHVDDNQHQQFTRGSVRFVLL